MYVSGLGRDSLRKIRTDDAGKMDVEHLKAEVEAVVAKNESMPLMIVATAGKFEIRQATSFFTSFLALTYEFFTGTGRTGAIDPINSIQDVASEHSVWMHIDGTMSGPLLQSANYKDKLAGANRSDSFTWSSSFIFGVRISQILTKINAFQYFCTMHRCRRRPASF